MILLAFAVAACGSVKAPPDASPPCEAGCPQTGPDGMLAVGGKRSPNDTDRIGDAGPDGSQDGAPSAAPSDAGLPDLIADAATDLPAMPRPDLAPELGLQPAPDAGPDRAPPDLSPVLSDAAPDLSADRAPDLSPDLAADLPPVVVPPDAGSDLPPDLPPAGGCPAGRGPAMVKAGADIGAQPFCVDSSEVTNAQYAAFLAATGDGTQTGDQPGACGWNTSYKPDTDGAPWPYQAGRENRPVVNVDWCDARAFCRWAGKRLCGKIGGGSLAGWVAGADVPTSQWASACTRAGERNYPYGATFKATACNTGAPSESIQYLADVKSYPQCEGGHAGIFDMSGNVEEWVDACDRSTGATDGCASAGSSAYLGGLTPSEITCPDSFYSTPRNTRYVMLGFRCCADL